jgi:membrane-associated phospholipid phosphatase
MIDRSIGWQHTLAIWVSAISNPVLVVALSLVYLTNRFATDLGDVVKYSATGLSLIVIGPALVYILIRWRHDRKIDVDVTNRSDRPLPLLVASIGALLGGTLISSRFDIPSLLFISQTLVMMLLVLTVVTTVWKISIHTSTLSALITLLVVLRGPELAVLYVLLIPVAWARVLLRKHSIAQIIGGSLLGIVVTYFCWLALGR